MIDPIHPTTVTVSKVRFAMSDDHSMHAVSTLVFCGVDEPVHLVTTTRGPVATPAAEPSTVPARLASHFEKGFFKKAVADPPAGGAPPCGGVRMLQPKLATVAELPPTHITIGDDAREPLSHPSEDM